MLKCRRYSGTVRFSSEAVRGVPGDHGLSKGLVAGGRRGRGRTVEGDGVADVNGGAGVRDATCSGESDFQYSANDNGGREGLSDGIVAGVG